MLQLLNFGTHNGYLFVGIYLQLAATVLLAASGPVNSHQVRRGRSLADGKEQP
jgi:hypothetical protein